MIGRICVLLMIVMVFTAGLEALTIPSEAVEQPIPEQQAGALNETELILVIVGAVCATILILSILD